MNTLLVIDDEPLIRDSLKRLLEKNNYQVLSAESVEQASTILSKQACDLILSDLRLPGEPGIRLLEYFPDIPIIIMTSYASVSSAVEAMKMGARDYISKPFDHTELLIMVERILKERKLELENTVLKAPFAGIAILYEAFRDGQKRKPREGDTVLMYQPILYLPDVTKFIVKTRVREVDLYKVRVGQEAMVHIDAYPDLGFPARVRFIGSLASGENDSGGGKYFQVSLDLLGQDRRLRPGMTARVHIRSESAEDVLLLPVQAVFRDADGAPFCYLVRPGGLRKTPLTTGRRNELQIEVLSGLKAGDLVSLVAPQKEPLE